MPCSVSDSEKAFWEGRATTDEFNGYNQYTKDLYIEKHGGPPARTERSCPELESRQKPTEHENETTRMLCEIMTILEKRLPKTCVKMKDRVVGLNKWWMTHKEFDRKTSNG